MILLLGTVRAPSPVWLSHLLVVLLLVLAGAGAFAVVTCRTPPRQVVLLSLYGVVLSLGFLVLQAPDVTLSEITIGSIVLPLLLLLTLSKLKGQAEERKEREPRDA